MTTRPDVSDALPELSSGPIDRRRLAYMAVAMQDPNLLHLDEAYAAKCGFPGLVAHGTFAISLALAAVTQAFSVARLRSYDIRLVAPVFVGDDIRTSARVTSRTDTHVVFELSASVGQRTVARGVATVVVARPANGDAPTSDRPTG
jgi:acyl dehydratase